MGREIIPRRSSQYFATKIAKELFMPVSTVRAIVDAYITEIRKSALESDAPICMEKFVVLKRYVTKPRPYNNLRPNAGKDVKRGKVSGVKGPTYSFKVTTTPTFKIALRERFDTQGQ